MADTADPAQPRCAVVAELNLESLAGVRDPAVLMYGTLDCMRLHRIDVERIMIARDGMRAILIFRAPDAEAVRLACRHARIDCDRIWSCRE